ncbi:hypothetical protein RE476_04330 [Methanolobus mangrovi]|uniref:Uncharacterized protein n=1 Tax=Methanolobus mangrovi TaxID=3072977 RepID=A0AA51UHN7_9EURY|nr:hypothetical protein [Methanolobus mangrovi]WMW23064.1 hypothetical protein RE476_04330 [Methanolobus mangrovi]
MNKRSFLVATATFVVLILSVTLVTADEVTVSRSISEYGINTGDALVVSVSITTNTELVTLGLQEMVPSGWEVEVTSSELFTYSASNNEWIWSDFSNNVPYGTVTTIEYKLKVPETEESGEYLISGNVLGRQLPAQGGNRISIPVSGDSQIIISELVSDDSNDVASGVSDSKTSGFSSTSTDNFQQAEVSENITTSAVEGLDLDVNEESKKSTASESAESDDLYSNSESIENKVGYDNLFTVSLLIFCLAGLYRLGER